MGDFPARIHVLFARESKYALVIRRGPSKRVCTIRWNRKDHSFKVGQWLKGRIYEYSSDLSPDGKHMIYFALDGKWDSETCGTWTAISKTPYLKAVGLWGKGNCYGGGGLFVSNREYWINSSDSHKSLLQPKSLIEISSASFDKKFGDEYKGVYFRRLFLGGWKLFRRDFSQQFSNAYIFEKEINSRWKLVKHCIGTTRPPKGKGCYYDEHQLFDKATGKSEAFVDWEWADVYKKCVYWAEKGKLFLSKVGIKGMEGITELHDFNDMVFENIKAPY